MKEAINATHPTDLAEPTVASPRTRYSSDDLGFDSPQAVPVDHRARRRISTSPSLSATHRTSKQWETSGYPASRSGSRKPPSRPHLGKRTSMTDDADLPGPKNPPRFTATFAELTYALRPTWSSLSWQASPPGWGVPRRGQRGCVPRRHRVAADGTMTVTLEDVLSNTDGQVIKPCIDCGQQGRRPQREAILVTVAGGRTVRLMSFTTDLAATESFLGMTALLSPQPSPGSSSGLCNGLHADDLLRGFRGNQLSGPLPRGGMHPPATAS